MGQGTKLSRKVGFKLYLRPRKSWNCGQIIFGNGRESPRNFFGNFFRLNLRQKVNNNASVKFVLARILRDQLEIRIYLVVPKSVARGNLVLENLSGQIVELFSGNAHPFNRKGQGKSK